MKVIKCNTKVTTVLGGISAIITSISIRDNRVSYEASYFNNGTYTSIWLNDYEFTINENEKIGYNYLNIKLQ